MLDNSSLWRQSALSCSLLGLCQYVCKCREFSGQSAAATSPQRSAHSLGGLPVGGLAVGRGALRGERGLSATKTGGLSSSKKRGDAMRRSDRQLECFSLQHGRLMARWQCLAVESALVAATCCLSALCQFLLLLMLIVIPICQLILGLVCGS